MDKDEQRRVGSLVRERMAQLGLNQAELYRAAGVSDATARLVMNGDIDGRDAKKLADVSVALRWTPDSLYRMASGGEPIEADRRPEVPMPDLAAVALEMRRVADALIALTDGQQPD